MVAGEKTLLVLGANPETASLVKRLNALGIRSVVTDYDPDAYAKQFATVAANVDASDVEALLGLAEDEEVDGVVVGVAEALLPCYCELCERLGVPAYSTREIFNELTNKGAFKRVCSRYGVGVAESFEPEEVPTESFPVVVKPADGCSSRGISVCRCAAELEHAVRIARDSSRTGSVLVEKYLEGDEFISYYAMRRGEVSLVAACDRYTYTPVGGGVQLPTAYVFPSRHLQEYLRGADGKVRSLIEGEGLRDGSIFFQGFFCGDGLFRFYEPGFRLNGAQEHLIVAPATGLDVKDVYVDVALGGGVLEWGVSELADPALGGKCGCKLSPIVRGGRISSLVGLEEIAELPGVVSVNPSYREGDEVPGDGTLKQIACRFFVLCDSKEGLKSTLDSIRSLFKVLDENGDDMVVGRFDTAVLEEG